MDEAQTIAYALVGLIGLVLSVLWLCLPLIIMNRLGKMMRQNEQLIHLLNVIANHTRPSGSEAIRIGPSPRVESYYVQNQSGKTEGPFSKSQLKVLINGGQLSPESICAREGDKEWYPVGMLFER